MAEKKTWTDEQVREHKLAAVREAMTFVATVPEADQPVIVLAVIEKYFKLVRR